MQAPARGSIGKRRFLTFVHTDARMGVRNDVVKTRRVTGKPWPGSTETKNGSVVTLMPSFRA